MLDRAGNAFICLFDSQTFAEFLPCALAFVELSLTRGLFLVHAGKCSPGTRIKCRMFFFLIIVALKCRLIVHSHGINVDFTVKINHFHFIQSISVSFVVFCIF